MNPKVIGQRIAAARKLSRPAYRQEDLAKALGVSRSAVAMWETGSPCPPDMYSRVLELTNVSQAVLERIVPDFFVGERPTLYSAVSLKMVPFWGAVPSVGWKVPSEEGPRVEAHVIEDTHNIIAVRISGENLAPRLSHSQLVLVRLNHFAREGVLNLVLSDNGDLTLKTFRTKGRGGEGFYSVVGDEYDPTSKNWKALGYVIGLEEYDAAGIRP